MIDWHSHILPAMDDGSHSVSESKAMLQMHTEQRIDTVIATPHFYANDESPETFLNRRKEAFDALKEQMTEKSPYILLGAEVRYYQGINRLAELRSLCIEGGKLLLLEMPMTVWTEYMLRELIELSGKNSLKIILAHCERYFGIQNRNVWERLSENGILMQVNASFFNSIASRHRALSLLKKGTIRFIGSDCHNTTSRPPDIGKAYEIIEKKLGSDFINQMDEYGRSMLNIMNK